MTARQIEVRLAWLSLLLALVTLAVLAAIDLHLRNDTSPQGIVSFELCAYSGSCRAIVDTWEPSGRVWAGLSLGLDYLFMLLYSAAIFLGLRRVADGLPERLAGVTRLMAWSAWGAGGMDAFENFALAQLLVSPEVMSYAWPAAIFATMKFAIIGTTIIWLVVAWAYRGVAGKR